MTLPPEIEALLQAAVEEDTIRCMDQSMQDVIDEEFGPDNTYMDVS